MFISAVRSLTTIKAQLPDTEQFDNYEAEMLSEGGVDLPEDSVVNAESSDGRGFEDFDVSDQEDEDYVINVEEESESENPEPAIFKKPANKKEVSCSDNTFSSLICSPVNIV